RPPATVLGAVSDLLSVTGDADIAGATLNLPGGNTYFPTTTYTLIQASGNLIGTFANFPQGTMLSDGIHYVNYTASAVQLAPVPEPATALAVAAAGCGLLGWARRRRAGAAAVA